MALHEMVGNGQSWKTITVIICTRNRAKDLARLLDSIRSQTRRADQIIVVDSSDNEETRQLIANAPGAVDYLRSAPGLTLQRNIGIGKSSCDYVLFLDDDTVLEPDFLKVIAETFQEYPDVAGVTGRIANAGIEKDRWLRILKKMFFLIGQGKGRFKLSGFPEHYVGDSFTYVEVCPGGCTAYRREIFDDHKFDEQLSGYAYLEDVDFSYRVSRKHRLVYQPMSRLAHYPVTYKRVPPRQLRRMLVRNHVYLFRKNQPLDLAHVYGFSMSIVGLLFFNALVNHDIKACIGIIEGLVDSFRGGGQ